MLAAMKNYYFDLHMWCEQLRLIHVVLHPAAQRIWGYSWYLFVSVWMGHLALWHQNHNNRGKLMLYQTSLPVPFSVLWFSAVAFVERLWKRPELLVQMDSWTWWADSLSPPNDCTNAKDRCTQLEDKCIFVHSVFGTYSKLFSFSMNWRPNYVY